MEQEWNLQTDQHMGEDKIQEQLEWCHHNRDDIL